jgi:phosphatidylserine/phosphatidylglycerophosphate/cardiolipin synthase-like enzyme
VLLLSFGALTVAAIVLAAALAPEARGSERAVVAAVLVPALSIGLVYGLSAMDAITPLAWSVSSVLVSASVAFALGPRARSTVLGDAAVLWQTARGVGASSVLCATAATGAASVGLATLAAGLLEPWAWDALGYHLPIVHDALQSRTLREVPTSVVYVNAYPRLVDVFFVAWRLGLRDETWVELGQLPFTAVGVSAIAALARRAGVEREHALAGAFLWLALPIVMLQLATAYIDLAVGALCLATFVLVTAPLRGRAELVAGLAAGLLLGSKPSAPPLVAVALATLLLRCAREQRLGRAVLGCLLALSIGGWKYLENLREHANPIWPVELSLGPIRFAGKVGMAELTASNLPEPYRSMGWLARLASSWTAQPERWVFDMRIGGFGPLFTFGLLPAALVIALATLRRPMLRAALRPIVLPIGLVVAATLATPAAYWSRYTLAVPGALLALVLAGLRELRPRAQAAVAIAAIGLATTGFALSWRGLAEGGPSLLELLALSPQERVTAYAIDGQEADWRAARLRIREGEAFGYDWCLGLPGRLARRDGRGRIAFLSDTRVRFEPLLEWIEQERVRVVALEEGPGRAAELARAHPERFEELFVSGYPDWQPCVVFAVRDGRAASLGDRTAGGPEPDGLELVESWPVETNLDDLELPEAHEVWPEMIAGAEQRLDFLEFYGASEPGGRLEPVIDAIRDAAARGVRVRFVFDAGFRERQPEVPARLAEIPGVEVRSLDLRAITGGAQHAKLFVVDDREAFVGSQNFDWRSLEHIDELGVRLREASLVRGARAVFELDWAMAGGASFPEASAGLAARGLTIDAEPSDTRFRGAAVRARLVASPRDLLPTTAAWEWPALRAGIEGARERVRLQVMSYQVRGRGEDRWEELDGALRAAASRGVRVELLVSAWDTRPGRIEALQSLARVPGLEVRIATIPEARRGFIPYARTVHAKFATFDRRLGWVGTSNAGGDYFLRSRNVGVIVEGAAFAAALDAHFGRLWSSDHARPVDPDAVYEAPRIGE